MRDDAPCCTSKLMSSRNPTGIEIGGQSLDLILMNMLCHFVKQVVICDQQNRPAVKDRLASVEGDLCVPNRVLSATNGGVRSVLKNGSNGGAVDLQRVCEVLKYCLHHFLWQRVGNR